MQFLIINASPHKNGNTARFVDAFKKAAESVGEVAELQLHDTPPPFSRGVYPSLRPDILSEYQKEILACDALFIATPTYWFNVPSILKALLESLDEIETELFQRTRVFGVAIYAPEGGEFGVASMLILPLNHLNFALVENGYVYHRGIPKDDWAWGDISAMPSAMKRVLGK